MLDIRRIRSGRLPAVSLEEPGSRALLLQQRIPQGMLFEEDSLMGRVIALLVVAFGMIPVRD